MATKIPGYHGQLLEIDLTAKSIKTVDLDPKLAKDYIGGRAMGGKMLLDAYGPNWAKIDPLSPEALLLVLAGPFVGFLGCKANFVCKSPQSFGIVGAQGSGDFISELRFCGYDGIILKGKAASPVYLTIFDDKVEIRDASKMWGKEIRETHQMIVDEHGNRTSQVLHRAGGRESGAVCGGADRMVPGVGARGRGRGDGVEEPQGAGLQRPGPDARGGGPEETARAD